jgi:replicative DNA helicase
MPEIPASIRLPNTEAFRPQSLWETVQAFNQRLRSGNLENYRPAPLGFPQLDACLGGGLRAEDLCLVGGMQNVGKTIFALQVARNLAKGGEVLPIVVCYEHGPETLLHRLICLESVDDPDAPSSGGVTRDMIEKAVLTYYDANRTREARQRLDMDWLLANVPGVDRAWYRMREYLWRLWLVGGDGLETTLQVLQEYVRMAHNLGFTRVMLIVDYAQRVPLPPRAGGADFSEEQRIDLVMRGLKGIAMKLGVPVMAVAAADEAALRRQRVHFEDLWGPATVQYEPDVAIILNRDTRDSTGGERWVRIAIEKNRHGPSEVEFQFRLLGAQYTLDSIGAVVPAKDSLQAQRVVLQPTPLVAPDVARQADLGY